ncbi:MAG: cysteine desulfurase [Actinobacteria bacterium]|nr:cysteine desulfurase [Actinomycetota bacterium]
MAYLDHAATTPVRPVALKAWAQSAARVGNPSSLHNAGRASRRVVEEARESIAANLGVRPNDVVFTSGGTEADNIAIKGLYWQAIAENPARSTLVVSPVEHHAVLDAVEWLVNHQGASVVWIPVDNQGLLDLTWLDEYLTVNARNVALVAAMWANNETGVITPIDAVAALCAQHSVPLHCDAVQGVAWLPGPGSWLVGPTALAISGHKFGAPVGVGALVLNGVTPEPLTHGGGQEIDVRSGTVATALISSMAAALDESTRNRTADVDRLAGLTHELRAALVMAVPDVVLNTADTRQLPTITSASFPGCKADSLLMLLDAANVACSAGSACTAGVPRPSHVLAAMGLSDDRATSSLRFSLGWDSRSADISALAAALPAAVARSRQATSRTARTRTKVQVRR